MVDPGATQPLRALQRSKEVRAARKVLRQKIKDGEVDGLAVLRGASREWENVAVDMRVDAVLLAVPGVGEITTDEMLELFKLRGQMRLSGLTYALREQMAEVLNGALHGHPVALPEPPSS